MNRKKALVLGGTGQDAKYLIELLLEKGYEVHATKRRASSKNTQRIDHLYDNPDFILHYGDITDATNIIRLIQETQPSEIYILAAQSHVQISFEMPEYTMQVDGLGVLRVLEAIRVLNITDRVRVYNASTSELFGKVQEIPQKESTAFYPQSPYACAKLYAYWMCKLYRSAYNMYVVSGTLFNHESPERGPNFVTRKITTAVSRISCGLQKSFSLGNLNALRDWGHSKEYVQAMWLMLQQEEPQDFIIATGQQHSVREFVEQSFKRVNIEIEWQGIGVNEIGINKTNGQTVVTIDPKYFRPAEVDTLLGDSSLAKEKLNWQPIVTFDQLVDEMMERDLQDAKKELYLKEKINV